MSPLPVAAAAARRGLMTRGAAIAGRALNAGWNIESWSNLFKQWLPSVNITYVVKAQGDKSTPPRQVLHLALATAFGMAISRRLAKSNIVINVNHRLNMVEVKYTITTVAAELALGDSLEKLGSAAKKVFQGDVTGAARSVTDAIGLTDIGKSIGDGLYDIGKKLFGSASKTPGLNVGRITADAGTSIGSNVTNPQMIPIPGATPVRGVMEAGVVTGAAAARAPWLRERGADPNPTNRNDGPLVNQAVEQQDKLTNETGPRVAFDLAKSDLFTGATPWAAQVQPPPEPFETIRKTNTREKDNPVVTTRGQFPNPQFSAAAGVDLRTLVAQVLHDPNMWPPEPQTDAGPATVVEYR